VEDTTLNQALSPSFQAYTGPVAGIQEEYINTGADSLNITAATPNWFIHSGSGNDAIAVSSGTNVLDGGTGSNFLTGGSGADTFFVDDRGPTADIWSTVNNFHAGDAATIWGVTPQDYSLDWVDGQGAAGYTGLTLHATVPGLPTASLTLVGFTQWISTPGASRSPSARRTVVYTCTCTTIADTINFPGGAPINDFIGPASSLAEIAVEPASIRFGQRMRGRGAARECSLARQTAPQTCRNRSPAWWPSVSGANTDAGLTSRRLCARVGKACATVLPMAIEAIVGPVSLGLDLVEPPRSLYLRL
jgi:hypothetical protein